MKSLCLWVIFAVVLDAIQLGESSFHGWRRCGQNERYVDCLKGCNTCVSRGHCPFDGIRCEPGCDCLEGYFRNRQGRCVPADLCDEPGQPPCRFDEEFRKCGCVKSCCNRGNPDVCSRQCLTGCFCRGGLVRDQFGNCISVENCPREPAGNCGIDEQYYTNKPDCKNTCENYNNPGVRCRAGEPGCFCKEGLVKRKDGKCVRPEDCSGGCGYNEEIVECAKPRWCNTCEIKGNCKLSTCTRGCDCKRGYLRNQGGTCINALRCPGQPGRACGMPESCAIGCYIDYESRPCPFCRCPTQPGGQCLRRGEVFKECGSPCEETCFNYRFRIGIVCPQKCKPGCFCRDGLVRNSNRDCVEPSQCEIRQCGENAAYKICGPACPATCTERNPICIQSCTPGCFCNPGFIKENQGGRCIPENQCPSGQCLRRGEEFKKCGSPCERTCSNYHFRIGILCPQKCKPGCFCKNGLVRDSNRNCVEPSECKSQICPLVNCKQGCYLDRNAKPCPKCACEGNPREVCGENEEYQSCGTACPPTCANPNRICIQVCRPGCFCKRGFIRLGDRGRCIPKNLCPPVQCATPVCAKGCRIDYSSEPCPSCKCDSNPKEVCGENEEYQPCGTACPPTCANPSRICIQTCRPGCFCKRGFIRLGDRGGCIPQNLCPPVQCSIPVCAEGCRIDYSSEPCPSCKCDSNPNEVCGENEEYQPCGTACPPTCANQIRICTQVCRPGCFCKRGFIRGSDRGGCIPKNLCPPVQCAIPVCAEGCRIDYSSEPCPSCKCDSNPNDRCPPDEEYLVCGSSCPNTCDNYGKPRICPTICVPGCYCKNGLVRTEDGRCIIPERCRRDKCNKDEEFQSCGSACPDTCDNYGKPRICSRQCVAGCFCKSGLVRGSDYRCIPPEECSGGIQCATPVCAEGCRIDYDSKPCPSCKCDTNPGRGPCLLPLCLEPCRLVYDSKPCPTCKCDGVPGQCRADEEYLECGSSCPSTCDNYGKSRICPTVCVPGCFCKKGLVRTEDGRCVMPERCPRDKCNDDEEFRSCGSACPDTCENYGKSRICTMQCVAGCFCKSGLVRGDNFRCIPPEQCPPGIQCSPPRCAKGCKIDYNTKPCPSCNCNGRPPVQCQRRGEVYKNCSSPCEANCFNYLHHFRIGIVCPQKCKPGCFCKDGLIRDSNRDCVEPSQCNSTSIQCSPPRCAEGCKIDYNTKPCPSCNCNRRPPVQCQRRGEVYKNCSSPCEANCFNYIHHIHIGIVCPQKCKPGCFCKDGLIRDSNRDCVEPSECNSTSIQCSPPRCAEGCKIDYNTKPCPSCNCNGRPPIQCQRRGEVYKNCSSPCEPNCLNYIHHFRIGIVCPQKCKPGCFCKDGLIRDSNRDCVEPSQCNSTSIQCSPPRCAEGCKIDYNTKPCPSCNCNGRPPDQCRADEIYSECGTCEDTCDNYGKPRVCIAACIPGCFCKRGMVRTNEGRCVIPELCGKVPDQCNDDEEFRTCGSTCPGTCDSQGKPRACSFVCVRGCFCKSGLIRSNDFKCIPPEECPRDQSCPAIDCIEGCYLDSNAKPCPTCVCPGKPTEPPCPTPMCAEGCEIDYSGRCPTCKCDTLPEGPKCGIPRCKEGCRIDYSTKPCPSCKCDAGGNNNPPSDDYDEEEDYEYESEDDYESEDEYEYESEENTDTGGDIGPACSIPACREGCKIVKVPNEPCPKCVCKGPICFLPLCREGCKIVKVPNQPCPKCVCPNEPPGKQCGQDEEHVECVPCGNTCETYEQRLYCKAACKPGCTCREGLVKRKDGKCVTPSECNSTTGGPKCSIPLCKEGCKIVKVPNEPCPKCVCKGPICHLPLCREGCKIVKVPNQPCPKCVCPNEPVCRQNEEYYECMPTCKGTCETYDKDFLCNQLCVPGCFCKKGFVKRKDGECVKPENCLNKPEDCGENEEYRSCGTACPPTCVNRKPTCVKKCVKGCFCKNGFVKDADGKCIPLNQCPKETCGKHEIYNSCGTACQPTCKIPDPTCTKQCAQGCFCREGYIRESKDGACIPRRFCDDNKECGLNEEYSDCVNPCNNCEIKGKCNFLVCNKGCDCIKGYFRGSQGKCIPENQCPNTNQCGPQEQYYECKPDCRNTCENYGRNDTICTEECSEGCFCKEGLVKRRDGNCVKPDHCNDELCGPDEEYYRCKPFCANRCQPLKICPRICLRGCFCRQGLVLRNDDKCVPKDQCDQKEPVCPEDEQFYQCIPECRNNCEAYGRDDIVCSAICKPGCFCREGLIKRSDGKCVPPDQCNATMPTCPKDEQYYRCKPECGNTCETCGKDIACPAICEPGCFCKEGLVRRSDGKCVEPDECEDEVPDKSCPQIRCKSGCYLDEDHKPCPRCVCDKEPGDGPCPQLKCRSDCYLDENHKPCPRCACDEEPGECGPDEQFYRCKPFCLNKCEVPRMCPDICVPGCFCREGLVLAEDGTCVEREQCSCTSPDQQYYTCKPDCTNTCERYGRNDTGCSASCSAGCFCREGLVLRKDGKCVPPDQCNVRGDCGENEEYRSCGTACPPTCVNRKPTCVKKCVKGCFCKKGFVKDADGKCIPLNECPKECPKPNCPRECILDKSAKPCPRCNCFKRARLRLCPTEECLPGCHTEYRLNECPRCVCPKKRSDVDESSDSENDSVEFDSSESVSRTEDEKGEFEEEDFFFKKNTNDRRLFGRDFESESSAYDFSSEMESEEDYDYSDYSDEESDQTSSEDQSSSSN